jgi:hypothetical protein
VRRRLRRPRRQLLHLALGLLNAFESRRCGVRWALGSMAKPVLPDAAFGEVWRNISENLRGVGVASASSFCPRAIPGNQLI